jgi:aspartyl-tRNA synthetase
MGRARQQLENATSAGRRLAGAATQLPRTPLAAAAGAANGSRLRVSGWVAAVRDQKQVQFVVISDRSGQLQVTNRREEHPELAEFARVSDIMMAHRSLDCRQQ